MSRSRLPSLLKAILPRPAAVALASTVLAAAFLAPAPTTQAVDGFGPIRKDRAQILDLPEGFSYRIIARAGDKMTDGFFTPGLADGMAALPGPDGLTILICNHEFRIGHPEELGPFKGKESLFRKFDAAMIYDKGGQGKPCLGSTTTLVYDVQARRLKGQFLNMVGTLANCSGGSTPNHTWLSCEEVFENPGANCAQKHGYVYEGPISTEPRVIKPVPLRALGRFQHEGVAAAPQTGIIYMTEDQTEGLFYRFIPVRPEQLADGGRLQCLAVTERPQFDTRNWKGSVLSPGEAVPVYWIDLENVDPETDDLRRRGHELGAALFASGEGICYDRGVVYFDCTNGSRTGRGQVWRYTPSPFEGTAQEKDTPARLELLVEPNDPLIMDHPDQITIAPWGDMFVCEDGDDGNYLLGITPQRTIYKFAWNALNESDLSGVCFSPDGSTMFLNILEPGVTLAITGPWKK